jgi:RHS repeat-associated protein
MVVTEENKTKHYFIEGERVCSKLATGFGSAGVDPYSLPLTSVSGKEFKDISEDLWTMTLRGAECSGMNTKYLTIEPGFKFKTDSDPELVLYFYHPDHLGSSSFITDVDGLAYQHLQYLPFGEVFFDQRMGNPARYTFSAKEKDEETSYSYFGARYYDAELSVWLSVDPLAGAYPEFSPFMYCAGNPIILLDPDGNDIIPVNAAGDISINNYLKKFSNKALTRAFGLSKKIGNDPKSGNYNIYTSAYKGTYCTKESFVKSLGKDSKKMSESDVNEAWAFYQALASNDQYKVEAWIPGTARSQDNYEVNGSEIVDVIPGYASREVNNNKYLEMDLIETNYDKIFDPERSSADNYFSNEFNLYKNYVRNDKNPNDKNTKGVIIFDARKSDWDNKLGKAFEIIFNEVIYE